MATEILELSFKKITPSDCAKEQPDMTEEKGKKSCYIGMS